MCICSLLPLLVPFHLLSNSLLKAGTDLRTAAVMHHKMCMVSCMFMKYRRVESTNLQRTTFWRFLRQTQRDSLRSWGAFVVQCEHKFTFIDLLHRVTDRMQMQSFQYLACSLRSSNLCFILSFLIVRGCLGWQLYSRTCVRMHISCCITATAGKSVPAFRPTLCRTAEQITIHSSV